jgi:hypothetical protein
MAAWLVAAPDQKVLIIPLGYSPVLVGLFSVLFGLVYVCAIHPHPHPIQPTFLLPPSPHNQMGNEPKPQQQEKAAEEEEARGPHKIAAGEGWIFCT